MFTEFRRDPAPRSDVPRHIEDVERATEIANATLQVQKFQEALAREYMEQHPDDPMVDGYKAAVSNLAALTDAGIVRGHLRPLEQIGAES